MVEWRGCNCRKKGTAVMVHTNRSRFPSLPVACPSKPQGKHGKHQWGQLAVHKVFFCLVVFFYFGCFHNNYKPFKLRGTASQETESSVQCDCRVLKSFLFWSRILLYLLNLPKYPVNENSELKTAELFWYEKVLDKVWGLGIIKQRLPTVRSSR